MKVKLLAIAGLAALYILVTQLPWERQSSGLTEWLYTQGEQQEENANIITETAVSGLEGEGGLAGDHEVDGSNWSIPNIIRHLIGGSKANE